MKFLTEDLLNSIKLRSMIPISQSTFQDADLVMLANEELQLKLVSDIMRIRENFFLTYELRPIRAGVDGYTMPPRAIGNALKLVSYVDASSNKTKLALRDVDQIANIDTTATQPSFYYIAGDQVVSVPAPQTASGSFRFDFFARPSQLCLTSLCAAITSTSSATNFTTFTVNTDLTGTLTVGSLVDVLSAASPFVLWATKVPITAITSSTIQVATPLVIDASGAVMPQVADYICPTGFANIAQVPQEFHPVLAQMVANRLLWGIGDMNKYQLGVQTLKEDRENALALIKNRVEASPPRISTAGGILSAFNTPKF